MAAQLPDCPAWWTWEKFMKWEYVAMHSAVRVALGPGRSAESGFGHAGPPRKTGALSPLYPLPASWPSPSFRHCQGLGQTAGTP